MRRCRKRNRREPVRIHAAHVDADPHGLGSGGAGRRRLAGGHLSAPDSRRRGAAAPAPRLAGRDHCHHRVLGARCRSNPRALADTLAFIADRNPDLLSIGVRAATRRNCCSTSATMRRHWTAPPGAPSTDSAISVPVWQRRAAVGHGRTAISSPCALHGWRGHLQDPSLKLSGFVFLVCAVLFYFYLQAHAARARSVARGAATRARRLRHADRRPGGAGPPGQHRAGQQVDQPDARRTRGQARSAVHLRRSAGVGPMARSCHAAELPWQRALADKQPQARRAPECQQQRAAPVMRCAPTVRRSWTMPAASRPWW